MNRRTFVWVAVSAGAIISIPYSCREWIRFRKLDPLADPEALLDILGDDTCLYLGSKYLELYPAENTAATLTKNMAVANSSGTATHYLGHSVIEEEIRKKIFHEFDQSEMLLIDGWLLSHTEARQCALFYLKQQNR